VGTRDLCNPPEKGGKKKENKKTLVLTLGSPPEKGGKKQKEKENPGINPGQPAGKGRKKEENPSINPGQPAGKGRKKKTLVPIWVSGPRLSGPGQKGGGKKTLVLTLGSPPEKGGKKKNPGPDLCFTISTFRTWTLNFRTSTDRRTDKAINI
jgi:hypothetical protein